MKIKKEFALDCGAYTVILINELRSQGRYSTADKYQSSMRSFSKFLAGKRISTIGFDQMNSSLIRDYNNWMKRHGLIPNTISFYNRILRSVYNKAVKEFHLKNRNPFENVYTGVARTIKRAASGREIAGVIGSKDDSKFKIALSRDLFAFSYFTRGMPFVDMAYLKKSYIKGDYLIYNRHKTGVRMQVRLEPEAKKIIAKYAEQTVSSKYVFPIIGQAQGEQAYQRYRSSLASNNRFLKSFQDKVSLDLTYYVSRHSWASNARSLDIPVDVISESLGHSNERTTEIYLSTLDAGKLDKANRKVLGGIKKLISPAE